MIVITFKKTKISMIVFYLFSDFFLQNLDIIVFLPDFIDIFY